VNKHKFIKKRSTGSKNQIVMMSEEDPGPDPGPSLVSVSLSDEEEDLKEEEDTKEKIDILYDDDAASNEINQQLTSRDQEEVLVTDKTDAASTKPSDDDGNIETSLVNDDYNHQEDKKMLELEQERGQLTAELMSKDILITKLEKESSSLKAELAQNEGQHINSIADHERKFLQLSEEMAAKVAEVKLSFINGFFLK
jgi:hypothetical protein